MMKKLKHRLSTSLLSNGRQPGEKGLTASASSSRPNGYEPVANGTPKLNGEDFRRQIRQKEERGSLRSKMLHAISKIRCLVGPPFCAKRGTTPRSPFTSPRVTFDGGCFLASDAAEESTDIVRELDVSLLKKRSRKVRDNHRYTSQSNSFLAT